MFSLVSHLSHSFFLITFVFLIQKLFSNISLVKSKIKITLLACLTWGGTLLFLVLNIASRGVSLKWGGSPSIISITIIPNDQMSTAVP